jgi:hypothetical protein
MSASDPAVDAYLAELSPLLGGTARWRRRVLAEVEDHALSALESGRDEELPAVGVVAAGFAETLARRAFGRAEEWTLGCAAAFVVSTQTWNVGGVPGAAGWITSQIAAAAAVITWLRWRRLRPAATVSVGALALSIRSAALAVGSVLVALALDAPAVLGSASRTVEIGLAVTGGLAVVALYFVVCADGCRRRMRRLGHRGGEPPASALEVLRWAVLDVGGFGAVDRILGWALAGRMRTSAVVGAVAGAALAGASLREHGLAGGTHQALLSMLAAGVLFAIEGGAVVVSALLFDRLLRLWPPADQAGRRIG